MSRIIKYTFIIFFLVLLSAGGYWFFQGRTLQDIKTADKDSLAEAVTLAIKTINLIQGEQGIEFWRLKATWGGIQQEDDVINVSEPNVRYTIGTEEEEDYLYAVSKQGKITDNQRVLTMWEDVVVTRNADVITGTLLVYTSENRQVHFPEGAHLESTSLSGLFDDLRWLMDRNQIVAEGVDLIFKAREATKPAPVPAAGDDAGKAASEATSDPSLPDAPLKEEI